MFFQTTFFQEEISHCDELSEQKPVDLDRRFPLLKIRSFSLQEVNARELCLYFDQHKIPYERHYHMELPVVSTGMRSNIAGNLSLSLCFNKNEVFCACGFMQSDKCKLNIKLLNCINNANNRMSTTKFILVDGVGLTASFSILSEDQFSPRMVTGYIVKLIEDVEAIYSDIIKRINI